MKNAHFWIPCSAKSKQREHYALNGMNVALILRLANECVACLVSEYMLHTLVRESLKARLSQDDNSKATINRVQFWHSQLNRLRDEKGAVSFVESLQLGSIVNKSKEIMDKT